MVLSVEHIVFVSCDYDEALILVLGEANVDLEVVHDLADVLPAQTDQPPVYTRVDVYFFAELAVL